MPTLDLSIPNELRLILRWEAENAKCDNRRLFGQLTVVLFDLTQANTGEDAIAQTPP